MAVTKKKIPKELLWFLIGLALLIGLVWSYKTSSDAVDRIKPFEQLQKANRLKCEHECKQDTACLQDCLKKYNLK